VNLRREYDRCTRRVATTVVVSRTPSCGLSVATLRYLLAIGEICAGGAGNALCSFIVDAACSSPLRKIWTGTSVPSADQSAQKGRTKVQNSKFYHNGERIEQLQRSWAGGSRMISYFSVVPRHGVLFFLSSLRQGRRDQSCSSDLL
jgi:hypothetical protein